MSLFIPLYSSIEDSPTKSIISDRHFDFPSFPRVDPEHCPYSDISHANHQISL